MIKVAVTGAMGKMGKEVTKLVLNSPDMKLVCAIDKFNVGEKVYNEVIVEDDIEKSIKLHKPDIAVDFTQPSCIFENAKIYLKNGVRPVIGTTGLSDIQIEELKKLSKENNTGCLIAPNFALGAVLMMMFAKTAAKYFNNAEIIELHHNQKKDAPSGTAIKTAKMMTSVNKNLKSGNIQDTELIEGSRGGVYEEDGKGLINIHSVRMPGFIASQEVIFGADGQTLTVRHDTINRECFMSGVKLGIEYIFEHNEFIFGLENIL